MTCTCPLCRPDLHPGVQAHPKWGYDLDAVAETNCLICKEPIGDEPYMESTGLARFGQMLFYHSRCLKEEKHG